MERRLSNQEEIGEKFPTTGVVVFIFNEDLEVLVLQENHSKIATGKELGNYGVLCETTEAGETWEETLIRGLEEELGVDQDQISSFFINPNYCFLGESMFTDGVLARVAAIFWAGNIEELLLTKGDGEVTVIGWEKPTNLQNYNLRTGVRKVLQECLSEKIFPQDLRTLSENFIPLSLNNLKIVKY